MNLENTVAIHRIAFIPILVIVFYLPFEWRYLASACIFALASVTDWFDGSIARKLKKTSPFGAFLDPLADKLLVATALILLVEAHDNAILAIPALMIISTEIVVSALREWMVQFSEQRSVAASFMAKVKTGFQVVAIVVLLAIGPLADDFLIVIGLVLLYAAVVLTLWSMYLNVKLAWPNLLSGLSPKPTKD